MLTAAIRRWPPRCFATSSAAPRSRPNTLSAISFAGVRGACQPIAAPGLYAPEGLRSPPDERVPELNIGDEGDSGQLEHFWDYFVAGENARCSVGYTFRDTDY